MLTRSTFLTALTSLFVLPLGASAEDKPNDTVIEQLQGRWEIVAGVNQGRELSETEVGGTYVTITINKITTYDRDERQRYQAVFRVDESKKPMHITMTAVEKIAPTNKLKAKDRVANAVSSGILKFDGQGKWQLCYALPGADRPEKFESPEGSKNMLFSFEKRQGDPVPDVLKKYSVE